MAAPLKKPDVPARRLLHVGAAPQKTAHPEGSDGQTVAPKANVATPAQPESAPGAPAVEPSEAPAAGDGIREAEVRADAAPADPGEHEEVPQATPHGATESVKPTCKEPAAKNGVNLSSAGQAELLHNVDAEYVEKLRSTIAKKPIWKSASFWGICGAMIVVIGVCGILVVQHNAEQAAKLEENARINKILRRAQEINKQGIETLGDAEKKHVDVHCTKEEARFLMDVVVNPDMKGVDGKPLGGNHPEGMAQLACMLLSIASEADPDISKLVFAHLAKDATKIKPTLYRWLVQRLAVANIKGINGKLHKLAETIAKKSGKKFPRRDEILSYIWESMGLRVTEKDIPMITDLLRKPGLSNGLSRTLAHCLDNIVEQMDSMDKKKELGDRIFDLLPEEQRQNLIITLAKSCSPKALTYYKQRAADPKNWRADRNFFSNYGQDDILEYLQDDLMSIAGTDERRRKVVQGMIDGIARQNRDRSPEDAKKFISILYDKIDEDTSEWVDVMAQTNPEAATFIGKDDPKYPALMEKRAALEVAHQQKLDCIKMLSAMYDWPWVVQLLERFSKENDNVIVAEAKRALDRAHANRAENERVREGYKQRTR